MMHLGKGSLQQIVITEDDGLDLDVLLARDDQPAIQSPSHTTSSEKAQYSPPLTRNGAFASHTSNHMHPVISACEEDGAEKNEQWVLPAPAAPGDYLSTALHRVPSKPILKTTSSYASFEMDNSLSASRSTLAKRSSFLSLRDFSTHSQSSSQSNPRRTPESLVVAVGWDLDDSHLSRSKYLDNPHRSLTKLQRSCSADKAAGSVIVDDVSAHSGKHSIGSSQKVQRSVSFDNVFVREYDRTIGDNPGCRSGPPLSLDWSYSKKESKSLDEYEEERSGERADHKHRRKFHMNKYKRRNMLSFHWDYTEEEMKAARKETKKLQRQRNMTIYLLPIHLAHEGIIYLKSLVSRKSSSDDLADETLSGSSTTSGGTFNNGQVGMPQPSTHHVCVPGSSSSLGTT